MARGIAHLQVEGYKELQRAIRKAEDRDLPKRIGQAHKEVGKFIISHLEPSPDPRAVGEGAGARVRPSASRREVLLRVGGGHRTNYPARIPDSNPDAKAWAYVQWGRRQVGDIGSERPPRPHIIGTALKHETEIRQTLLDEVLKALGPAFYDAK